MEAVHNRGARDDRVLSTTRILSAVITPILLAGFAILYIFPDRTGQLFAWAMRPRMTPMMLGAAYLGGAYFFSRAAFAQRWHVIKAGFFPVVIFAGLLGVTTILHWNRFNHHHITFYVWVVLYFTTPFLLLADWARNRRLDPGTAAPGDRLLPVAARAALVVLGVVILTVAGLLFLSPNRAMSVWPWALTPLTARVIAAMFALAGVGLIGVGSDARWSAARIPVESQVIALAALDLAMVFARSSFSRSNPLGWLFAGSMLTMLVGLLALLAVMATPTPRAPV